MTRSIQSSFSKGEISPELFGRVDLRAYQNALARARNAIIHQFGGVSNRPGTQYIGPVFDHGVTPRLLPFSFKTTDTHIIELGAGYFRFLRNDAHITDTTTTITGITQANPAVVTAVAHGLSNDDEVLLASIGGMTELNGAMYGITVLSADTFSVQDQVTDASVDSTAFTAYTSGGTVKRVYQIANEYAQDDLRNIKYAQTADVMTLTHPTYPVMELRREAVNSWVFEEVSFRPDITYPLTLATSGGAGGVDAYYQVTAIADDGEESLPGLNATPGTITGITNADPAVVTVVAHGLVAGDQIEIQGVVGMTELNLRRFEVGTVIDVDNFELSGEDSTTFAAYISGGSVYKCFVFNTNTANVTITWAEVDGAVRYRVFKKDQGVFGFLASTDGLTYIDPGTITPDTGDTPPRLTEPFRGVDNYPRAVGFHQQRRTLGGSNNEPDTTYFSVIGNFDNFSAAIPVRADDGFAVTLASGQVNEIRHYISAGDLLILTSGSEWAANGSNGDSRFSVDTINLNEQTNWGVGEIAPLLIGDTVLFMTQAQNSVRTLNYSFQADSYLAEEVSLLAKHLFKNEQALEWARTRVDEPIIFVVMTDGSMACFTFNKEQEVAAWTTWDTTGKYESVATILPSADSIYDELYYVVKRKINGTTVRYIERTVPRRFEDVRDCKFLDSSLSLDSPIDITGVAFAANVTITAPSHGFADGDYVDIVGIEWEPVFDALRNETFPAELNNFRYIVSDKTADTFKLKSIEDGTYIDGTTFEGVYVEGGEVRKAVLTLSGLQHLRNTPVYVLADGNVITNLTVSALGVITLPRRFSRVHVGLPYVTDIQTLSPEHTTQDGSSIQGQPKSIAYVDVKFNESRGLFVGPDSDSLIEMKQREFEVLGAPTALFSGTKRINIESHWETAGTLFLRQLWPLPLTILALIPDLEVGMDV